jgi:hypothetical protein
MATPQFRTPTGRLTAYSFSCGYRERRSTDRDGYGKNGLDSEIYRDGAIYHVRQHDRRSEATKFRVFWTSFRTLAEARNLFNRQRGKLIDASS